MKKIFIISCMLVLSCTVLGQRTTPLFNGDENTKTLGAYLGQLCNPEIMDSITGTFVVMVKFSIDVDGSVVDAKILKSAHPILDKEALRMFNSMSKDKWTPAFNRGKPVKTEMVYPVIFTDKPDDIKVTSGPTHQTR